MWAAIVSTIAVGESSVVSKVNRAARRVGRKSLLALDASLPVSIRPDQTGIDGKGFPAD